MLNKLAILLLLACLVPPASARMYQWVDPASGTTQLSGKPPAWYRSNSGGPRVLVFDNGRVVDDTGIQVNEGERERLRLQALLEAEQDRQTARQQLNEAQRLKALVEQERRNREEANEDPDIVQFEPTGEQGETDEAHAEEEDEATENAMRSLIEEWERLRTENARRIIGSGDNPPPPPAPGR